MELDADSMEGSVNGCPCHIHWMGRGTPPQPERHVTPGRSPGSRQVARELLAKLPPQDFDGAPRSVLERAERSAKSDGATLHPGIGLDFYRFLNRWWSLGQIQWGLVGQEADPVVLPQIEACLKGTNLMARRYTERMCFLIV